MNPVFQNQILEEKILHDIYVNFDMITGIKREDMTNPEAEHLRHALRHVDEERGSKWIAILPFCNRAAERARCCKSYNRLLASSESFERSPLNNEMCPVMDSSFMRSTT